MSQPDQIAPGKVVTMTYTLTGQDGKILDESGAEGMDYLHGADNIVPGLEQQLLWRAVGDKIKAVALPMAGYARRQGSPQHGSRTCLPADVEIEGGMELLAEGPGGYPMPLWVGGVRRGTGEIDGNHPLARLPLTFDVEVLGIR